MYYFFNFITAQSSYASAVLGIVILSVRPFVRHTRALGRNEKKTYTCNFYTHER